MSGAYVIFEGGDGVGKSTLMTAVAERLRADDRFKDQVVTTIQPGGTPLGAHLRKLVKFPHQVGEDIVLDELSRQLLYMVDSIACARQVIQPALDAGKIVLSDRSSFISSLVYGVADGLDVAEIDRLSSIINPPKAERLYILQCPYDKAKARLPERSEEGRKDHYDTKPSAFFAKIESVYNNLLTGPVEWKILVNRVAALENVKYIDSSLDKEQLADNITDDIKNLGCLL